MRRLGIGYDFWNDMKAPHWPDFETLVTLRWDELSEDQQRRHWYEPSYHPSLLSLVRHKFPGFESIDRSYSQALQDIFILTFLDGKTDGTYLEIGSFHPTKINNTYLLSQQGWKGVSIDIWPGMHKKWQQVRPDSVFLEKDAMQIDYKKLVDQYDFPKQIDFLQTDIDAGKNDIVLLQNVLDTGRRFSIIMFEHNLFLGSDYEKKESTKILENLGYLKIANNIVCKDFNRDEWVVFEDWWVDPRIVDKKIIDKFFTPNSDFLHPLELLCQEGSIKDLMEPVWKQKDIWKQ